MNFKVFKDILTDKVDNTSGMVYSQARIYLLISVIFYFLGISLVIIKALFPTLKLDSDTLKTAIDWIQWAMLLFAGYAFGHKGIETLKTIFGKVPVVAGGGDGGDSDDNNNNQPVIVPSTAVPTTPVMTNISQTVPVSTTTTTTTTAVVTPEIVQPQQNNDGASATHTPQ